MEPQFADPVPVGPLRRPLLDYAEAQTEQARQLANDVGVGPHPMGDESFARQALLTPHQADPLYHFMSFHFGPIEAQIRSRLRGFPRQGSEAAAAVNSCWQIQSTSLIIPLDLSSPLA